MTGGRRFSLSSPDWGQDHLSLDAIVAYVDDELTAGAHARAEGHLAGCPECGAEVVAQRQARAALRTAAGPCLPSSLLRTLRSIPVDAELPPPPPGLGITADGQFVLLRDVPADGGSPRADPPTPGPGVSRRLSRRARFGAVSGLAIGALAIGALAAPEAPAPPSTGTPGAPVLAVPVQARLSAAQVLPALHPAVLNPAVVRTSAGDPTAAADPGDTDPAVADSAVARPDPTGSVDGSSAVLDPRVRARLDRSPVAFFRGP
jgi:Putative zinc-finger